MPKNSSSQNDTRRVALILMGLALLLLFLSFPESEAPKVSSGSSEGSSTSHSTGPADLIETKVKVQREELQVTLEHERLTSQTPKVGPVYQRPIDYGLELEGESIELESIDPSVPVDTRSPRQDILQHLKAMQDHQQWRVHRNEAFVREVLRRAREDGWIVSLDENLKVIEVKRVRPAPYRESSGGAVQ